MDPTLHFLWARKLGSRPLDGPQKWAISLLERSIESDAILRLAADSALDRDVIDMLVKRAIGDLKMERLLDDGELNDAYERASVLDYYAGLIDGWTLILRGCDLYYASGEPLRRQFWINIADDGDEHGGQGICCEYPFNRAPFDVVLKQALAMNGFEGTSSQVGSNVV